MQKLGNFGFLLYGLTRLYVRRFEQHAREFSLTLTQCRALVYLSRNQGISQSRLAELANIEPMMMVRTLDRMEAERLLERRPDPTDRRARRLYLTARSAPLLKFIGRLAAKTRREALAGLQKSDRKALIRMIDHIHGNLTALEAADLAQRGVAAEQANDRSKDRYAGSSASQAGR